MAQTYEQIQQQIQQLQQRADALRTAEVKEVVDRIKVAIAHYDLTADQLGLGVAKRVAGKRATASPVVAKTTGASKSKAQFSDLKGNEWGGRGPRPAWLREALAAGHDINEFRIGRRAKPKKATAVSAAVESTGTAASVAAVPAPAAPAKKKPTRVAKVSYGDDAGHAWSGMGPKPGWLKAAIAAGKPLSDFAR